MKIKLRAAQWARSLCRVMALALTICSARAVSPDLSAWQLKLSNDSTNLVMFSEDPEIVAAGNVVHVLCTESAVTNGNLRRLVYTRSLDNGQTFQPPVVLEEHEGLDLGLGRMRRLAADGSTVHVVATRTPVPGPDWNCHLEYYRSVNAGESFEPRRTLVSSDRAWHLRMPHVAAEGGRVTVAYLHYPNWYTDSRLNLLRSTDNGTTFAPKQVARADNEGYDLYDLVAAGDKLAVAFIGSKGIPGSYASTFRLLVGASTDGGDTWSVNQVCSTNSAGWPQTDSLSDYHEKPDLAWSGDRLLVTWTGLDTNDVRSVFIARSQDNGASFEPQVNLSAGHTGSPQYGQASIAARKERVYVVWNVPGSGIWLRHSDDGGTTWSIARRLFGGWWPMVAIDPSSTDGSKVHFLASPGLYRHSADGSKTIANTVNLSTVWSWTPNGVKNWQWSIAPDSVLHATFCGLQAPKLGYDYDLYYRRLAPAPPLETALNQCLVLNAAQQTLHYENMQISGAGTLALSNACTVELWMQPAPGCPPDASLFFQEHPDNYQGAIRLQTHAWNGRRPSAKILTTSGIVEVWGGELLGDGDWHHLALTYDSTAAGDNLRLYVDGRLSASTIGIGPIQTSDAAVYLGGAADSVYRTFNGAIDEVRVWNRALTEAELRVHTTARLHAVEPGLVAYYPLDGSAKEITGQSLDGTLMYKESFTSFTFAPKPQFTCASFTWAALGVPVVFETAADWATGFQIASGTPPPGVTFDAALGVFAGTPAVAGAWDLSVRATNAHGAAELPMRIAVTDATGLVFRDDFNVGLNPDWEIRRPTENPYHSSYPGGLQVRAHWGDLWAGGNHAANIFTIPAPQSDFTVTMAVSGFAPGENLWTQLFLVAADDDDNYLRLGYGWTGERSLSMVREAAGQPAGASIPINFGSGHFLLRLSKQGSLYQGFWSTNGTDFVAANPPMEFGDGTPSRIGFWLGIDPTQTNHARIDAFDVHSGAHPFMTSATQTAGQQGTPFAWRIAGPAGCVFKASGLPPGLVIDSQSGLISGTPLHPGPVETVISASNHNGVATQKLWITVADSERSCFRDDFSGDFVPGWDPLPAHTSYYWLTNGSQLLVRANNGDTWQHYNRELNLFTVPVPNAPHWEATLGVSRFAPAPVDYNSLHLVAWKDTDNCVRLTYSHGGGSRNVGLTSENAQVMDSQGEARDFGEHPFHLRLIREGKQYRGLYSTNGVDFIPVSTNPVTLATAPEKVGFWMGIDPTQANLALIDYFDVRTSGPILKLTTSGDLLQLTWGAAPGVTYQVQTSMDLLQWTDYGAPSTGTGEALITPASAGNQPAYFRIHAETTGHSP